MRDCQRRIWTGSGSACCIVALAIRAGFSLLPVCSHLWLAGRHKKSPIGRCRRGCVVGSRQDDEAWQTNVPGAFDVLRAAGVEAFVNMSTDKAADLTRVLGYSKRLGGRLADWSAHDTRMASYVLVRFANVTGSRSSMLPAYTAQTEAGGPLTLPHPDVARSFTTIPEACRLVVQPGTIDRPGEEALILHVGERKIARSGRAISISVTSLRRGEELPKDPLELGEVDGRPVHPTISHTVLPPLCPDHPLFNHWARKDALRIDELRQVEAQRANDGHQNG